MGGFLPADFSKTAVADLRKSANRGVGEFLLADFSKYAVADLRKSANGGGGGNFCQQISVNLQWQI